MRLIFTVVLTVLGVTGSGCRCSPATPTSVTIRVKNASRDPIYLNDTDRRLGVQVMRTVGGTQYAFDEHPCECKTCDQACSNNCFTCADGGVSFIARLSAGESASRTWDGVVQVASYACGASCLSAENAPLDETFTMFPDPLQASVYTAEIATEPGEAVTENSFVIEPVHDMQLLDPGLIGRHVHFLQRLGRLALGNTAIRPGFQGFEGAGTHHEHQSEQDRAHDPECHVSNAVPARVHADSRRKQY